MAPTPTIYRAACISDLHLGLRVEDLDRTPEIEKALNFAIDKAIAAEVDAFFILGDLTHTATPPYYVIAIILSALLRLERAGISTWILRGNHEATADENLWALTPIEKAGFEHVKCVKQPSIFAGPGNHVFAFLPHLVRREIKASKFDTGSHWYSDTLRRAKELAEKRGGKVTAFSHTNVDGARAGTENLMLRQSDLQFPKTQLAGLGITQVFSGHIHTPQKVGKIFIIGSPVCTDFGDVHPDRGFIFMDMLEDGTWEIERVQTPQAPLVELKYDLTLLTPAEFAAAARQDIAEKLTLETIAKVKVRLDPERAAEFDLASVETAVRGACLALRAFEKTFAKARRVRDEGQRRSLSPRDAIQRFVSRIKPKDADRKLALAYQLMEDGKPGELPVSAGLIDSDVAANDYFKKVSDQVIGQAKRSGLMEING